MNGDDVIQFEEANREALVAEWMRMYGEEPDEDSEEWNNFVIDAAAEWNADKEQEEDI